MEDEKENENEINKETDSSTHHSVQNLSVNDKEIDDQYKSFNNTLKELLTLPLEGTSNSKTGKANVLNHEFQGNSKDDAPQEWTEKKEEHKIDTSSLDHKTLKEINLSKTEIELKESMEKESYLKLKNQNMSPRLKK